MLPDDVDEVSTKLDLAKAFIDMGDAEGAKSSLEEVLSEGTPFQNEPPGRKRGHPCLYVQHRPVQPAYLQHRTTPVQLPAVPIDNAAAFASRNKLNHRIRFSGPVCA